MVIPVPLAGEKIQLPIIVGAIDCDKAGAPSERKNVLAEPFTAVSPTAPVGFAPVAPPDGAHVPSPRQNVVDDALVPPFKFPTGRFPVTPPALEDARLITGKSAEANARNVGCPVEPFGAAKTLFVVCVFKVAVNVPELVTGVPDHV